MPFGWIKEGVEVLMNGDPGSEKKRVLSRSHDSSGIGSPSGCQQFESQSSTRQNESDELLIVDIAL